MVQQIDKILGEIDQEIAINKAKIRADTLYSWKYAHINSLNYEFTEISELNPWDIFRFNKKLWVKGYHSMWVLPKNQGGLDEPDTIKLTWETKSFVVAKLKF